MAIKLPATKLYGGDLLSYLHDHVWKCYIEERDRLHQFKLWVRASQACPAIPAHHRNAERRMLLELSRTPWMYLMVKTFEQQLIVDGYRKSGSNDNALAWDTWNRNHMARQQFTLNRDMLTYGYTFVKVTDSEDPITGKSMAAIRTKSPLQVYALWEDPFEDEWPQYVLERQANGQYWWWSDEDYTILNMADGPQVKFEIVETVSHDYGLVPFVRYSNDIDSDGKCWGDVEPLIEIAKRIDKTKFDLLLTQHFTGFMVRWATGLMQPDGATNEQVDAEKMRLAQESFLISSNKDAKFGTMSPGPLDGLIEAYRESLKDFLAVAQLPTNLAGAIVNVAADALAAGTRPHVQKLWQKQTMLGVGHNQVLRLVNMLEGRMDEADDIKLAVHWQDVEIKSLAQFADAWGKMVDQLKVPAWGVWPMIPGIDQSQVEGWKTDYLSDNDFISYIRTLQEAKTDPFGQQGGSNSAQNQQSPNNKTGEPASLNKTAPGANSGK